MTAYRLQQLPQSRKLALATLAAAWALDLGHSLFVLQGLSLIKVTLLLLSVTLALAKTKGSAIGCALVCLVMALICFGTATALGFATPSSRLIVALGSLALFVMTALCLGISAIQSGTSAKKTIP